jgi:hypothetical protein
VLKLVRLLRVVVAEVRAAAFLALDRRARDGLRHRQQIVQVDRRVPAVVVLAIAVDAAASAARAPSAVERAPRASRIPADDADQVLHHVLQIALHGVGILAGAAALERRQRLASPPSRPGRSSIVPAPCCFANSAANSPARLPKTIRSRASCRRGGWRRASRPRLRRGEEPGTVDICVSPSTRFPPIV